MKMTGHLHLVSFIGQGQDNRDSLWMTGGKTGSILQPLLHCSSEIQLSLALRVFLQGGNVLWIKASCGIWESIINLYGALLWFCLLCSLRYHSFITRNNFYLLLSSFFFPITRQLMARSFISFSTFLIPSSPSWYKSYNNFISNYSSP